MFQWTQVQSPTDLSKQALDRMSEIVDTQLGYVRGLGNYLTSALKVLSNS